nr:hypothetical protein [Verrucomicrobiota bacterium]
MKRLIPRVAQCQAARALVLAASAAWALSSAASPLPWRWSNPTPHGANIVDIAWAGGLAVQVGERGQIFTSTDLDSWTPRDSHTDRSLR